MERLTKRLDNGEPALDCKNCELEQGFGCGYRLCIERLLARVADYEDTKLTPPEVRSMSGEWRAMMAVLNSIGSYDRLRELAEADKDGRLVVQPCKPGTEVWVTRHDKVWPMYFVAPTLSAVCPDMPVHCQKETCADGPCKAYFGTDAREFGKTVFLSREEAEKALERMKCDGN